MNIKENNEEREIEFSPEGLSEEQTREFQEIFKRFVKKYEETPNRPAEAWMSEQLKEELPDKTEEEISEITAEILESVHVYDDNLHDLHKQCQDGITKESWFAKKVMDSAKDVGTNRMAGYLEGLDQCIKEANDTMWNAASIRRADGVISQNANLDGFIAEQYHAQTFNMNAKASGSEYHAEVLEPEGNGYKKNSVDVVIVDGKGKIVRKYQSKYCKDSKATEKAFENGDYRGQRKLVPEGQQEGIQKKTATVIEAPDGTTSNPFSKKNAQQMRDEAQSGSPRELGYNDYQLKDLALNIGKQAGTIGVQAAFFGMGVNAVQKAVNGEEIEADEVLEAGLAAGSDAFVKTAAGGALKVAAEKELISVIPKGTAAGTLTQIACMGVENAKIFWKLAKGEITTSEAANQMGRTNVALFAGLKAAAVGAAKGAALLSGIPVVGSLIGGFVGGAVGYTAGSRFGERVYEGAKKLQNGRLKRLRKTLKKQRKWRGK